MAKIPGSEIEETLKQLAALSRQVQLVASAVERAKAQAECSRERPQPFGAYQSPPLPYGSSSPAEAACRKEQQRLQVARADLERMLGRARYLVDACDRSLDANEQDRKEVRRDEPAGVRSQFKQAADTIDADIRQINQWRQQLLEAIAGAERLVRATTPSGPSRAHSGGASMPYSSPFLSTSRYRTTPSIDDHLRSTRNLCAAHRSAPYSAGPPHYARPGLGRGVPDSGSALDGIMRPRQLSGYTRSAQLMYPLSPYQKLHYDPAYDVIRVSDALGGNPTNRLLVPDMRRPGRYYELANETAAAHGMYLATQRLHRQLSQDRYDSLLGGMRSLSMGYAGFRGTYAR